jgi:hypothetical protein
LQLTRRLEGPPEEPAIGQLVISSFLSSIGRNPDELCEMPSMPKFDVSLDESLAILKQVLPLMSLQRA